MRITMLCATLALSFVVTATQAKETAPLDWAALVDIEAQEFEDPYRDLAPDQLSNLITVVRLRERLASDTVAAEARPRIKARLAEIETSLAQAGIDIDWLIGQRWVVAERRKAAALAGNSDLDGRSVEIGGFIIPAPPAEDGTPTAYLVPERGMCSHMPPPPPNQLLQLRLSEAYEAPFLYTPVIVRGTVHLKETNRDIFVVDGPVPMWSAWTMQTDSLAPLAVQGISDVPSAHQGG